MKEKLLQILKKLLKFFAKLTVARYKPGIIGITGNVGKTSTKEAVGLVISSGRSVRVSSKSFNNELGLPLTILGDWKQAGGFFFWIWVLCVSALNILIRKSSYPEILVMEYGIDRVGDMDYLLGIAQPHVGVFTAVGDIPSHVEFFSNTRAVAKEKARLIGNLPATGFAVLNADDPLVMEESRMSKANSVTFGFSGEASVKISSFSNHIDEHGGGVSFKLSYGKDSIPVRINGVVGRAPAYASAAAAAIGLIFGISFAKIGEALSRYEPPKGRQKIIPGVKKSVIIDDTYNASPLATEEALKTLKSISTKRKIVVLGDMLELGKYTLEAHEKIGKLSAEVADVLVTVGVRGKIIAESAERAGMPRKKIFSFLNIYEAGMQLQQKIQKGDIVLIKASQGVRMEKIVKEIMADPREAEKLLVRQDHTWLKKEGMYD